jgi:hypothetical protein
VQVFLAVAAARTLHHIYGLDIEMANVWISWILSQPDSLKKVYIAKGQATFTAPQTAGTV